MAIRLAGKHSVTACKKFRHMAGLDLTAPRTAPSRRTPAAKRCGKTPRSTSLVIPARLVLVGAGSSNPRWFNGLWLPARRFAAVGMTMFSDSGILPHTFKPIFSGDREERFA
jgi:hypothetical protein